MSSTRRNQYDTLLLPYLPGMRKPVSGQADFYTQVDLTGFRLQYLEHPTYGGSITSAQIKANIRGGVVDLPPGSWLLEQDGSSGAAVNLAGISDLVIRGHGTTLLLGEDIVGFQIDSCSRVRLEGFALDGQRGGASWSSNGIHISSCPGPIALADVRVDNPGGHGIFTAASPLTTLERVHVTNPNNTYTGVYCSSQAWLSGVSVSGNAAANGVQLNTYAKAQGVNLHTLKYGLVLRGTAAQASVVRAEAVEEGVRFTSFDENKLICASVKTADYGVRILSGCDNNTIFGLFTDTVTTPFSDAGTGNKLYA